MVKCSAFRQIESQANVETSKLKNCRSLLETISKKETRIVNQSFKKLLDFSEKKSTNIEQGLTKLISTCYRNNVKSIALFFNELELISLAYELIFRRMKSLKWKDNPKFLNMYRLVRSYLNCLWVMDSKKYDFIKEIIEQNTDLYTIVLDELLTWVYERERTVTLQLVVKKIKSYDQLKKQRIERLKRILNKYQQKATKGQILEFMRKVNSVRPRESLIYLLEGLFPHHEKQQKREAFNRLNKSKVSNEIKENRIKQAAEKLKSLIDKKKKETIKSIPYRSMFPIGPDSYSTSKEAVLAELIDSLEKKNIEKAFRKTRDYGYYKSFLQLPEEKEEILRIQRRQARIVEKRSQVITSTLNRIHLKKLSYPFRRIVSIRDNKKEDSIANAMQNLERLFTKRKIWAFNQIDQHSDEALNQKRMSHNEALSILDTLFKNKANTAFSQIKTLLIEFQVLEVTDVTNPNKLMFTAKEFLNMSGNLSGNWDVGSGRNILVGSTSNMIGELNRQTRHDTSGNFQEERTSIRGHMNTSSNAHMSKTTNVTSSNNTAVKRKHEERHTHVVERQQTDKKVKKDSMLSHKESLEYVNRGDLSMGNAINHPSPHGQQIKRTHTTVTNTSKTSGLGQMGRQADNTASGHIHGKKNTNSHQHSERGNILIGDAREEVEGSSSRKGRTVHEEYSERVSHKVKEGVSSIGENVIRKKLIQIETNNSEHGANNDRFLLDFDQPNRTLSPIPGMGRTPGNLQMNNQSSQGYNSNPQATITSTSKKTTTIINSSSKRRG